MFKSYNIYVGIGYSYIPVFKHKLCMYILYYSKNYYIFKIILINYYYLFLYIHNYKLPIIFNVFFSVPSS